MSGRRSWRTCSRITLPLAVIGALLGLAAARAGELKDDILQMTGARTKVLWLRASAGQKETAGAWDATEATYDLMGFDTQDGQTRRILAGPAAFGFPWIGPDGSHILYNDQPNRRVYTVNWDGSGKREVARGFGLMLWGEPQTGREWIILSDSMDDAGTIYRCPYDRPEERQVIWKGPMSRRFRLSADGKRAGGEFPWPQAGVANLGAGTWRQYGRGCNAMLAPDDSYRFFNMLGNHCEIVLYDDGGANPRTFSVQPPGITSPVWIPRWSSDPRFLTVKAPIEGPATDVYLGEFDKDFTRVARWLKVSTGGGANTYGYVWVEPGLGRHGGKAPFTVDFAAPDAGGAWSWEFGDGTAEAGTGRHTYEKEGAYTVTARRGDRQVRGWVNVRPRTVPAVRSVNLYDERRLSVAFEEPMRLGEGAVALKSGAPVRTASLSDDGLTLAVELEGGLAADDALDLGSLTDAAQVPNRLAQALVPVRRQAWPAARDGLVLLWDRNKEPAFAYNGTSRTFVPATPSRWGNARFDRWGAMLLDGSGFTVTDGAGGIVGECMRSGQFTLEATLSPLNRHQGNPRAPSPVFGCTEGSRSLDVSNFLLAQEGERLTLHLRVRVAPDREDTRIQRVELGALPDEGPCHVVVACDGTNVSAFLDGKRAGVPVRLEGSCRWKTPDFNEGLFFGGRPGHAYPWRGALEGVAVYSRALGEPAAQRNAAARRAALAGRKAIPRVEVEARAVALTPIPDPAKIAPYRNALAVGEFEIMKVLKGRLGDKVLRVAQWALEDGKPTDLARLKVGEVRRLALEPMPEHPEFESEFVQDALDFSDAALFVDVTPRVAGQPCVARIALTPQEVWLPLGTAGYPLKTALMDQYGNPIEAALKWTVEPGGEVNGGEWYGVGQYFDARGKTGAGTVDGAGRYTPAPGVTGTVTVAVTAADNPSVRAASTVAAGRIPGVNPAARRPLRFGEDGSGFRGDLDRVRLYRRALSAAEIADHAAGRGLDARDAGLVGDWPLDERRDGAYPNVASTGPAARVAGELPPAEEEGRRFVRFEGKGHLEIGVDPRLDFSQTGTIEAWVRTRSDGAIVSKLEVEGLGWQLRLWNGGLNLLGVGMGISTGCRHPAAGSWAHVVAVMDHDMAQRIYVDGKLVGERKPGPVTF